MNTKNALCIFFYKTITLRHTKMAGRITSTAITVLRFSLYTHTSFFPAVLPHLLVETEVLTTLHSVRSMLVHTCTALLAAVADLLSLCILRALLFLFQAMPKPTTPPLSVYIFSLHGPQNLLFNFLRTQF